MTPTTPDLYFFVYILYTSSIYFIPFYYVLFSRFRPRSTSLLSASDCGGKARALKFIYRATRKWRSIDSRDIALRIQKGKIYTFLNVRMLNGHAFQCVF